MRFNGLCSVSSMLNFIKNEQELKKKTTLNALRNIKSKEINESNECLWTNEKIKMFFLK